MKILIKTEEEMRAIEGITEGVSLGIPELHTILSEPIDTIFEGIGLDMVEKIGGKIIEVIEENKVNPNDPLPVEYPYFYEGTAKDPHQMFIPLFAIKEVVNESGD